MSYLKQMNMKSYYYLSLMLCALSAGVSAQEITKSTDVESERTLSADSIITQDKQLDLSLIHISEPTRQAEISYAVFCLKKKKTKIKKTKNRKKNNTKQ